MQLNCVEKFVISEMQANSKWKPEDGQGSYPLQQLLDTMKNLGGKGLIVLPATLSHSYALSEEGLNVRCD